MPREKEALQIDICRPAAEKLIGCIVLYHTCIVYFKQNSFDFGLRLEVTMATLKYSNFVQLCQL